MTEASLIVSLPLLAAVVTAASARVARPVGLIATAANAALAILLARRVLAEGAQVTHLGGWEAPLGIAFETDGLAAVMILMAAIVGVAVAVQASDDRTPRSATDPGAFWPLWLATLGAMNALFLSADLFNLYVTFEILGLAAVGLTALTGTRRALRAAFDYLSAGLAGSLLLLLGVALAYAAAGQVDLSVVPALTESAQGRISLALIFAGLAVKAALFPLHFWMPAAHSSAAPVASALLSALVVKAAIYVALRLSLDGGIGAEPLRVAMAAAGAGAMLWGSWHALRADRLKLLVAHSTVAQVGLISLALGVAPGAADSTLWHAAVLLMLSHAFAKAAMFLAVGRIAEELGHDRISGLNREELRPGAAEFAFAVAAVSLIGLPPTAGFVGKWVLIEGLIDRDAWIWVALVFAGTVLSAAYLSRVVSRCLRGGPHVAPGARRPQWRAGDVAALGLAVSALLLGLGSALPFALLEITVT
ncbi:Na(+)/H(+) antiporter subunit D [Roseivivax jejudonensis]|uniref:Na(+)/H(+) antiporter subunit D n=1 Tax=Roseivivax jejudonensis TaxID=1529041 RepID=A0A1X6Y6G0_9RHOB|nr:proton-conducting transporter membrane subunit [Roseivivax jejudonensis]SLN12276.1 Na(+)/H(+) antiporter subunit D [Roseivivax jejudonensis]